MYSRDKEKEHQCKLGTGELGLKRQVFGWGSGRDKNLPDKKKIWGRGRLPDTQSQLSKAQVCVIFRELHMTSTVWGACVFVCVKSEAGGRGTQCITR